MPATRDRSDTMPDEGPFEEPTHVKRITAWQARAALSLLGLLVLTVGVSAWILHHDAEALETKLELLRR